MVADAAQQTDGFETGSTAELILERAAGLFAQKGFAATSIREIAEAAGVTKPTLYYYFDSKEGLIQRIVHAAHEGFVARLSDADGPIEEALRSFVRDTLAYARARPATIQLLCRIEQVAPQEVESDIERMRAVGRAAFADIFAAAMARGEIGERDPRLYTLQLLGGLITLMDAVAREVIEGDTDAIADEFIELFFSGARAPERPSERSPT